MIFNQAEATSSVPIASQACVFIGGLRCVARMQRMQVASRSAGGGIECMLVFAGVRSRNDGIATVEEGSSEEDIERATSTIRGGECHNC